MGDDSNGAKIIVRARLLRIAAYRARLRAAGAAASAGKPVSDARGGGYGGGERYGDGARRNRSRRCDRRSRIAIPRKRGQRDAVPRARRRFPAGRDRAPRRADCGAGSDFHARAVAHAAAAAHFHARAYAHAAANFHAIAHAHFDACARAYARS